MTGQKKRQGVLYGIGMAVLLSGCSQIGLGIGFGSGNFGFGIGGNIPLPVKKQAHMLVTAPSAVVEQELQTELDALNRLRAEKSLPPLYRNRSLDAYAAVRAQELAQHFAHERPDGSNALKYVHGNTYKGENIAMTHSLSGRAVVQQWQNSPGHYDNMVCPDYRDIGIGAYAAPSGAVYWVQIFSGMEGSSDYRFETDR